MNTINNVTVLGLGYIGLPTAALAATHGHTVCGVDINPRVVEALNNGEAPFEEAGLSSLLQKAVKGGTLRAFLEPQPADVFLIIVPTPFMQETKQPDMRHVRAAAASIAPLLEAGNLVVLESTSPVGATRKDVADVIEQARPELKDKIFYAYCPERAIPGQTLHEMTHNDRSIGGLTPEATQKAADFYKTFVKGALLSTTSSIAEMVKLAENASRDVQIAFANELSMVCDGLGLEAKEVIKLANHHPRVNILQPGAGVGGHCIAVDPWFIISADRPNTPLMQAARGVNDKKPYWVVQKVEAAVSSLSKEPRPTIGLLGLAYKPDVDDLRESPALTVARALKEQKYTVKICEPHLEEHPEFPLVPLEELLEKSTVLVTLTAHSLFKNIPPEQLAGKIVVDAAGVWG